VLAAVASANAALSENFISGAQPTDAVTTSVPHDDAKVWASFVEIEGESEADTQTDGQLIGAEEFEEDYQLPASLAADEEDADSEEDTYALVEADAEYEPVVFEAASAGAEDAVTSESIEASTDMEAAGDAILSAMDEDDSYDHESMHAWTDPNRLDDSEVEDAPLVQQSEAAFVETDSDSDSDDSDEAEEEDSDEDEDVEGDMSESPSFIEESDETNDENDDVEEDMSESPVFVEESDETESEEADENDDVEEDMSESPM